MNNLQKMAKKKEYKKALVGKLKGAYHAAAKEGDKVMKKADKMKTANPAKVKALMAKGMGAKEAVKAAYPDWPDDKVAALAAKMGGMGKEAKAVYMCGTGKKAKAGFSKKQNESDKMGGMGKKAKAGFSKKYNDSAHLTGKQKNLPDFIQKKIVAKKAKEPAKKEMMDKEASMVAAGRMLAKSASAGTVAKGALTALKEGGKSLLSMARTPKETAKYLKEFAKSEGIKGTAKAHKKELAALGTGVVALGGAKKALSSDAA